MDEEDLSGGVANAGAVVRQGDHVLRPSNPYSASIHQALDSLRNAEFDGVPHPVGIDPDGRERLEFIPGDVPLPPYPAWARSDAALASIAALMRQLHDASTRVDLVAGPWSDEFLDPLPDLNRETVLCHHDVCLENVGFRDGLAVALIDFDFAAPGGRLSDLASFARMCVPIDDPANAARLGWGDADLPGRLRLVADAYGLDVDQRHELIDAVDRSFQVAGQFLRRRVAAGEPAFVVMWEEMGGHQRSERRSRWWTAERSSFSAALS